jgi:anti-anti-sigma factor
MTGQPPTLTIHESRMNGFVRLSLTGELDLGTAPVLEDRLTRLRATKSPVTLDLSRLDFIDSTGLHLLVRIVGDARMKRWQLRIEPDVAPQVMGVFRLVHLDHFLARDEGPPIVRGDLPSTGRGRAAPPSPDEPPATV